MAVHKPALVSKQDQRIKLIQHVFSTDKGQELLLDLKSRYVDVSMFDIDPYVMAKNCGHADLVLELIDAVENVTPLPKRKVLTGN